MLASDVITPARTILNDVAATRWPNATSILPWLGEGQRELLKRRPDAGLTATGITIEPATDPTATTDTLAVNTEWKGALIDYVCFRAFGEDSENTENAKRSGVHLQLFTARIS